ncbi:hypothetical protein PsorP6_002750 [Peronosclerospora sorghi]|uniref:Uncharacterized protein n=1 Tax=Peronosclerospora sorghi TaxID=230839 RepID=A0ACC0WP05_9STRA|nr:hypothetical protein PsorP6_002750 [Peronosclerospora sorghi]
MRCFVSEGFRSSRTSMNNAESITLSVSPFTGWCAIRLFRICAQVSRSSAQLFGIRTKHIQFIKLVALHDHNIEDIYSIV